MKHETRAVHAACCMLYFVLSKFALVIVPYSPRNSACNFPVFFQHIFISIFDEFCSCPNMHIYFYTPRAVKLCQEHAVAVMVVEHAGRTELGNACGGNIVPNDGLGHNAGYPALFL